VIANARRALRRAVAPRVDGLALRRYRALAARRRRPRELDRATLDGLHAMVEHAVDARRPQRALDRTVARAFRTLADADLSGERPSPQVRRALVRQFHRLYYHSHEQTWQDTRFLGVQVWKTPLDLWLYQELIHDLRPDVLIEAGTKFGGSAYYFARMFDLLGHGEVVTIDVEAQPGRPEHPRITYLDGSSTDPAVFARVGEILAGRTPLIVLDSSHRRRHVLAELRLWSPLVPVGSYIVVEDTHAGGHPVTTNIGRGPWAAVNDFLRETDDFEVDESMHKFLLTFNPRGYLRRVG
jgi:cephalosporin hydroxylase